MRQNHTILDYDGSPKDPAVEPFDDADESATEPQGPADDEPAAAAALVARVNERRELLRGRIGEARERGLDALVEVALAASEPRPDGRPITLDGYILRDQIRLLEMAIDELDGRFTAG